MNGITIVGMELIAPLVILIIYLRVKTARARRKADGEAASVRPFEPEAEPIPGFFLRYFPAPQRTYLRQQIALGKAFYYATAWIFIVLFTSGLLPPFISASGMQQLRPQGVWYSYLRHIAHGEIALGLMMLAAAAIAVVSLTTGSQAIFYRTRPLTHRFLFWARVLSAIATILASLATAIAVSFVLLLLFYGPVWLHLLDGLKSGMVLSHQQETQLVRLLQTSAPRIFLSFTTTALLICAVTIFLLIIGSRFPAGRSGKAAVAPVCAVLGVMSVQLVGIAKESSGLPISRVFFLYADLGPPPPYGYMFISLLTAAALLLLAQLFSRRIEL